MNAHTKSKLCGELTSEELYEAEKYWVRVVQQQSFSPEVKLLKVGRELSVFS